MTRRTQPWRGNCASGTGGLNGHTLAELMIAMALGLIVTAGAVSLYRSQRAALVHANDAMQMREAGLAALTLIGQQLQMTGFVPADAPQPRVRPALFGCSGARPAGADDALTCEALSGRSDGVAVRYVADDVSTWPSSTGQSTDCLGQAVGAGEIPLVNRFYAKQSGSTGEYELYCEGSGRVGTAQPLVEGVERLRIRYWTAGAQSAVDASALAPDQWPDVVAVDVCVLVRSAPQGRRVRYLDCDGASVLGADLRARQTFWRRIALRNNEEVPS